jgi:hypothetical protein
MKAAVRVLPVLLAVLPCAVAEEWLLVSSEEIAAAREKANKHQWARTALDALIADGERALRDPVDLPDRGGQWPHWYSCKKDGVRLRTVSPTEHRCPLCGEVYRGDPYDAVVLYGEHSRYSRAVRDLGLAFRFTGRGEFAAQAAEILTAYAGRYATYPRHNINGEDRVGGGRVMAQTLDESVWLIPVAWGYALVRETIAEPRRKQIEQNLLVAAADVIREHRMGIHNIQCWKNSAVALAGMMAGRDDLVKEAIEDPERGYRAQMAKGVTDEGLWWEGSLGYHRYTMDALWPMVEAARRNGIDIPTERYRLMYDAPLALALPNADAPGFNDSAGSNVATYGALYEIAFARWKRPEYGRVLARTPRNSLQALLYGEENVPSGPLIPTESALLKSAGYGVLRSSGITAAMRFGMHGGGHGHPDKLNIVTYGASALLGLDPGSINYGVPLHREWYRTTIAHNTVTVNEAPQANVDGALESWTPESIVANAGAAYPGVTLRRSLALRNSTLEDRFECSSDTEQTYDWAFHAPGKLTTSIALEPREGALGSANGYQHVRDVAEGRTDGVWWARWENGSARLTIRFEASPGTVIFTGYGPGKNPDDRVPMIVVRRRGTATTFEATHTVEHLRLLRLRPPQHPELALANVNERADRF